MNIYIGHYISVIKTVVISFIFLPFTTEVKMQIKSVRRQFIKEKCLANLTQSFPFFPIFFNALPFSFFYHCIILIRRSSLDNWIRIHLFFFSLNRCHSFPFALEKLCEPQNPMMIMKNFLMFICNCTISIIAYVIKSNTHYVTRNVE